MDDEPLPTVRRARRNDVPQILRLARENLLNGELSESVEERGFLVSGFSERDYEEFVYDADHFYVLEDRGELVGILLACNSEKTFSNFP